MAHAAPRRQDSAQVAALDGGAGSNGRDYCWHCGVASCRKATECKVCHPREKGTTRKFEGILFESQGQNLALTVLEVPSS